MGSLRVALVIIFVVVVFVIVFFLVFIFVWLTSNQDIDISHRAIRRGLSEILWTQITHIQWYAAGGEASSNGRLAVSTERSGDRRVFCTRTGKPFSDTNLLHRELKPAGAQVGAPWLNWHTLGRTHCTLFQQAGGSLRDAQAQLGHSKMSTTSDIYTMPSDKLRRETVEKLGQMVTNGDEFGRKVQDLPMPTTQIQ